MRFKRTIIAAGASTAMAATLLYAAGPTTADAANVLSGSLTIQTETSITPGLMAVVKQYEKLHPKVNVALITLNTSTARSVNILQLSSSAAPDIGFVELSTGVYSALTAHNELDSLAPVWTSDNLKTEYPAGSISYMNSGTSTTPYGMLLFAGLGSMIFYNRAEFAKAGVTAPAGHLFTSMAQFYALTNKLKAKGITPLSVGCNSPVAPGHLVDDLLPTAATPSQYAAYTNNWHKGTKSSVTYKSAPFVNTLQTIETWVKTGVIEAGCLSVNDAQQLANFVNGETAMVEGSTYDIPSLQGASTKPSFPLGWFMIPPVRADVKTPFWNYAGSMYVVPTHAQNRALAMNFLQFLGQTKNLSLYASVNASLPIVKNAVPEPEQYSFVNQVIDLQRVVGSALIWDSAVPDTLGQKFDAPVLQNMIAGKLSVMATAEQFQQQLVDLQTGKVVPPGQ